MTESGVKVEVRPPPAGHEFRTRQFMYYSDVSLISIDIQLISADINALSIIGHLTRVIEARVSRVEASTRVEAAASVWPIFYHFEEFWSSQTEAVFVAA